MKRLVFPLLALSLCPPVQAAPVHLTCAEFKSNDGELWTQQLLIDADRGYAKVASTEMGLIAKPSEFVLEKREMSPDFRMHQIWLNRQTLTFKRRWVFGSALGRQLGDPMIEREASGQCRITPARAGNKI